MYSVPPPDYVEPGVVMQDDYIYYPGYQIYYSRARRQFIYLDGRSWVARATPPRVSVEVLFAAPSVGLEFHDAPSFHHARVVQQYPQHWTPPGNYRENRGNGPANPGRGNY
jgi:hypothetical protein